MRLIPLLLSLILLLSPAALAADRHVFLDTDNNGILNDCPNPAHNAQGTSNTNDLQYCFGGTSTGKVIGTVTGTVSSATCTGGGGVATNVANGVSIDIDRDGTNESIYGHPQACVYNMARSDSCDIHSGLYQKAGWVGDNYSGQKLSWGVAEGTCASWRCLFGTVAAWGLGPNMTSLTAGYGTALAPGYLRGAVMNGSTDTWDADGDKAPDGYRCEYPTSSLTWYTTTHKRGTRCDGPSDTTTCINGGTCTLIDPDTSNASSYPVVFSGDIDNDNDHDEERSTCNGTPNGSAYNGSCTGDAWSMVWVGCGYKDNSGHYHVCRTSGYEANERGYWMDTDANGTFETEFGRTGYTSPPDTSHFIIKDIEFRYYNNGVVCDPNSCGVRRQGDGSEGNIMLQGDGSSDGMIVDHVWIHDNDYRQTSANTDQTFHAHFADPGNVNCASPTTLRNSYIRVSNEMLWNADGGQDNGCQLHVHNNVLQGQKLDTVRPGQHTPVFGYFKQLDYTGNVGNRRTRVDRWYNNVIIGSTSVWLFDLTFGNPTCDTGIGGTCPSPDNFNGTEMIYGNIFRCDPATFTSTPSCFPEFYPDAVGGCHDTCTDARWILFNNTMDFTNAPDGLGTGNTGGDTPSLLVEKNNAWFGQNANTVHLGTDTDAPVGPIRSNEVCSNTQASCTLSASGRSTWFSHSTYNTADLTLYNSLVAYTPSLTSPLLKAGSCDPDGDGTLGVDYDGDGVNDTTWLDIKGNTVHIKTVAVDGVDCAAGIALTDPPDAGAIQFESDATEPTQECGNNTQEGTEVCDGSDLDDETCITQGFPLGGNLSCNSECTGFVTSGCTIENPSTPDRKAKRGSGKQGPGIKIH